MREREKSLGSRNVRKTVCIFEPIFSHHLHNTMSVQTENEKKPFEKLKKNGWAFTFLVVISRAALKEKRRRVSEREGAREEKKWEKLAERRDL